MGEPVCPHLASARSWMTEYTAGVKAEGGGNYVQSQTAAPLTKADDVLSSHLLPGARSSIQEMWQDGKDKTMKETLTFSPKLFHSISTRAMIPSCLHSLCKYLAGFT